MKIYLHCTANLGDFLNALPVLSGIQKSHGNIEFIIRSGLRKFKGIKEFLMYQDIFSNIHYDDEYSDQSNLVLLSSWTREDKSHPNRPIETCRYENYLRDNYGFDFDVDDDFTIKFPECGIIVSENYYVGDRWNHKEVDDRRNTQVLAHLTDFEFLDYSNDLLTNAFIIKNSSKPFITNLTGVCVLADLLKKETYIVWKAEDWKQEFRNGDNISWDGGKDINKIFEKHMYLDRKCKMVHASELEKIL